MILLLGIPSEAPLRMVIEAAESQNVPYLVFNQRDSQFTDLFLENKNGKVDGFFYIRGRSWRLSSFSGVYVRMMDHQELPENKPRDRTTGRSEKIQKSYLLHEMLYDWLELTDCRVMNRNSAMSSNMSKPYQAQLITKVGFKTPRTMITNNPNEVKQFLHDHKRIIFKSISSVRSIVRELSDVKILDLEKVRYLPTQFQEYVDGINLRVHIVGEDIFATEVHTRATDYRYVEGEDQEINMVPIKLSTEIESRCFKLSRILNLPLCGIDLMRTSEGDYYCFEVNPSPGYSYYQINTGQDIAAAIVRYLI